MKEYLEIAKLTKTQGLKGELRAQYYCDDVDEINEFSTLYLEKGKAPLMLEHARPQKNIVVLKFSGIDTVEAAQELIGKTLYIDRKDVVLEEDTWFVQDIVGCEVIDADSGKVYGKVDDVLQYAPTDVYSVKTEDGRQLLFPAIPEVLLSVDVEGKKLLIRPLDGLFEDQA